MRQLTSRRAGSFLCFAPPFFASVAASALFSAACPFVPAAYKAEQRHTASSTWNRHVATRVLSRLPPLPPPLSLVSSPHHRRRRRLSRMAAPSVVLVPPTPYDVEKFPPRSSSVSPRTTVTVASARSSRSSYQYHAPTSSETTIFSIYSMYGEGKDGDADGAGSADNPRISYAKRLSNRISEVSMHSDDVYDGVVEVSTKAMVSADGSLSVEPTSYGRQQRNGFV